MSFAYIHRYQYIRKENEPIARDSYTYISVKERLLGWVW